MAHARGEGGTTGRLPPVTAVLLVWIKSAHICGPEMPPARRDAGPQGDAYRTSGTV